MVNQENILERLRKGEKITCIDCKKGIYITSAIKPSQSHEFICSKCGSVIRATPNIFVE